MAGTPLDNAKRIWAYDHQPGEVNAHFLFTRDITLAEVPGRAMLALLAESRYRLRVNGAWVGDGPARSYPDHRYYDDWDVTEHLRPGSNRIEVAVTHWGVDTFQSLSRPPFLTCSLRLGGETVLESDTSWSASRDTRSLQHVPRACCQLGFEEHYSAIAPKMAEAPAIEVAMAGSAPFSLSPRPTRPLTRVPRDFRSVLSTSQVRPIDRSWTFPVRRLFSPQPLGINILGMAGVVGATLSCSSPTTTEIFLLGPAASVQVNGALLSLKKEDDLFRAVVELSPGESWLSIAVCTEYDHATELAFGYRADREVGWTDARWLSSGPLWSTGVLTNNFLDPADAARLAGPFTAPFGGMFQADQEETGRIVSQLARAENEAAFRAACGESARILPPSQAATEDACFSIRTDLATSPDRLKESPLPKEVPSPGTRLLLDLGEMSIGYFEMEFDAPEGAVVDAYFFEHLERNEDGTATVQYLYQESISYRNSLRYTASEGRNHFLSRQRRGMRYALIVFRDAPVVIHSLRVIESTYAPEAVSTFSCSDEELNRIFAISQRTLLLCMEDTYTDCPTYEQTLWVGDARNEALFSAHAFGAYDLMRHSAEVAGHSLGGSSLIVSQCPSGWDTVIPSFSFLWGIGVWDTYWQTGDADWLERIFPAVMKNLDEACRLCTDGGLFSAKAWNFFDWTAIDQNQETVLHNSLLLAGALEAGIRCAEVLKKSAESERLTARRADLKAAINLLWDDESGSLPDAILPDGTPSAKTSQHTSFLALLFDVLPENRREKALENCLHPAPEMAPVGSPNALYFLIGAIRASHPAAVMEMVRSFWGRMVAAGSTTAWEMVNQEQSKFPTRSHCHGWSSSPAWLLPVHFFDLHQLAPGWSKVSIAPRVEGITHASAAVCTPHGLLRLTWRLCVGGKVETSVQAPAGVEVSILPPIFPTSPSHDHP